MKLFLSDLDNTLIYSYKKDIGIDKILVERKEGKALSYMTRRSYELLSKLQDRILFIPVTTRSLEQYARIRILQNTNPKYALAANGGILLNENKQDPDWYKESLDLISPANEQLETGKRLLYEDDNVCFDIRKIDGLFIFTKSNNPEETICSLRGKLDNTKVSVFHNGSKIYILPKELNKGMALQRMKEKLKPDYIISAGDSEFDIPMLEKADMALMPEELAETNFHTVGNRLEVRKEKIFSDVLLEYVWKNICSTE